MNEAGTAQEDVQTQVTGTYAGCAAGVMPVVRLRPLSVEVDAICRLKIG